MMLKISDLKKDMINLKSVLKNNKTFTEQERESINNQILMIKDMIDDLEVSGECIIEEL